MLHKWSWRNGLLLWPQRISYPENFYSFIKTHLTYHPCRVSPQWLKKLGLSTLPSVTVWNSVSYLSYPCEPLHFNSLSKFVIAFLPRSKPLLIVWMQCFWRVILGINQAVGKVRRKINKAQSPWGPWGVHKAEQAPGKAFFLGRK